MLRIGDIAIYGVPWALAIIGLSLAWLAYIAFRSRRKLWRLSSLIPAMLAPLLMGATFTGLPIVMTNAQLGLLPSWQYFSVLRLGVNSVGDAPAQWFVPSGTACTISGGDVGSEVPTADGGCMNAEPPSSGLDLRQFGGSTSASDNSTAIQHWANLACTFKLTAPSATFNFKTAPINFPICNGGQIAAGGMYGFTINYTGTSTTPDLVVFGDTTYTTQTKGWKVTGLNVDSSTTMTAGTAIHIADLVASSFDKSNASGQYAAGSGHLWNGIWCDYCFDNWYWNFEATAQNDVVRTSGQLGHAHSGFYYGNCKISNGAIGVHIGGGSGAIDPSNCDIIANGTNVVIDHAIVARGNTASIFDALTTIDSSSSGPGILVNDSLFVSNQNLIFAGTWDCTSATHGLYIQAVNGQRVYANFSALCNNQDDGLRIDDSAAKVYIGNGAGIYSNGLSGAGFGIDATALNQTIYLNGQPTNNTSGSWDANAFLGTDGGCISAAACWYKDFKGNITQYFQASFTGAANTLLTNTPSYPVAFPNHVSVITERCAPSGTANGASQMTVGPAIAPTLSAAEIFLVSSVTVTSAQNVNCTVQGN